MSAQIEARLEELETRVAFLDQSLIEMDAVLLAQSQRNDALEREIQRLERLLRQQLAGAESSSLQAASAADL